MFIKILGILDLFSALIFILYCYTPIKSHTLLLICAIYLLIKGLIFFLMKDFASLIDIICGIIFIITLLLILPMPIIAIASIFLIQKGLFSLVN